MMLPALRSIIAIGGLLTCIVIAYSFQISRNQNIRSTQRPHLKKILIETSGRKRLSCMLATVEDDVFDDLDIPASVDVSNLNADADIEDNTTPTNRQLVWSAAVKSSVRVKELGRTCEEYMRLPASEYSVLSAQQITRLSDSEFKCELPTMNFFGTKIQPVLFVDVNVFPEFNRSEIVVRRAETVGSETAVKVNGTFSISAINIVSAGEDEKGRKTLNSDTKLLINVLVPPSRFPLRVIQSGGNFLMQSSLNIIVPTFVRILSADFSRWSAGNNTRAAVEGAVLSTS